ncbi:MAG: hypothetical protein H8E66_08950 [Planctomycetes bacterium]|nr:hypothetical protein [Planctomycetota bacterium]
MRLLRVRIVNILRVATTGSKYYLIKLPMKSSTLIVWLLVAACVAINLAMIGELQIRRNEWPEAGGVIGLGLTLAQIALVALWTVWGLKNLIVRVISSLLSVWALSVLGSYSAVGRPDGAGPWFGLLLTYCGVSLVACMIAGSAGYKLSNHATDGQYLARHRTRSNQFTIWGLLSLMTAIGIALTVVKFAEFPISELLEMAAFLSLLATTGCLVLLLSLFLRHVIFAVIATAVVCPSVGFLLAVTGLAPAEGTLEFTMMTCTQGFALLSAAIVLRSSGFRLVREATVSSTTTSESSGASESESVDQRAEP